MNFKPTLWKTIVSVVLALLSNFIFVNLEGGCKGIYCYFPQSINYKFLWLLVLAIIYIIWSLFEKSGRKKK
jgi:hypothetical protein